MKKIIMVLLLATLAANVFSDGNVPKNNYTEIEYLNINPIFFSNSLSLNRPLNISSNKNDLFSNMVYERIITKEDKKSTFAGIMLLTDLSLWWSKDYRNWLKYNYDYFKNQWNKTLEEEEAIKRLMFNY